MLTITRRALLQALPAVSLFPAAALAAALHGVDHSAPEASMIYELRVYHIVPGKQNDLLARFRDHTDGLFARHGMKSLAYWTPLDEPAKSTTLIYILQHPSREAAAANWQSFQNDPEWISVRDKSQENGKLVVSIDSTFMAMTDFSPRLS